MKRLSTLFLKWLFVLAALGSTSFTPVDAVDTNSLVIGVSCGNRFYSVDRITGYNQFATLGCFPENRFLDALAAMNAAALEAPNVVVRNNSSNSPLNIVAADRAMAYSQNHTYLLPTSLTMSLHRNKELTIPFTFINQGNPLYYYGTEIRSKSGTEIITPSDLVVEIEVNGARGYVPLNGVDIIPLIYVENRNNNWLVSFTRRTADNVHFGTAIRPNITHYQVAPATIRTVNGDVSKRMIRILVNTAVSSFSLSLGIAPDWMANGTYYSADGIRFFTDMDLTNPVMNGSKIGLYYNYYQYLSLRSKSNYTGAELDIYHNFIRNPSRPSVLENQGAAFVNAQNEYGMNALLIYAMAIHESANGTSGYAIRYKNLFGYGAYDDNPNNISNFSYESVEECVNQHMGLNLRHYLDSSNFNVTANNSLFYSSSIGNKGAGINTRYASNPWWSVKIANWAFNIDRYLGFKDFDAYQIGILGEAERNIYKDLQATNVAYTVAARATDYSFIIHSSRNDVYYTYSTNPIAADGTVVTGRTSGVIPYDWDRSTVYIKKSQTTLANTAPESVTIINDKNNLIVHNDTLRWEADNSLTIKGYSALDNTNMNNVEVSHTLRAINLDDETKTHDFALTISSKPAFALNLLNGFDYSKAWFEGNLDLSVLPEAHYRFELVTVAGDVTGVSSLVNSDVSAPLPSPLVNAGSNYRFVFNNAQRMRYELYIEKGLEFVSSRYPTRFYPVAFLNSYSIVDDTFKFDGLAYIIGNPTGANNGVVHRLLILSSDGVQTLHNLETNTGRYDYSNGGFDYTHAWFKGSIDLNTLSTGRYRLYILTTSNGLTDAIELRNYVNSMDYTADSVSRAYRIATNPVLNRRLSLHILSKS